MVDFLIPTATQTGITYNHLLQKIIFPASTCQGVVVHFVVIMDKVPAHFSDRANIFGFSMLIPDIELICYLESWIWMEIFNPCTWKCHPNNIAIADSRPRHNDATVHAANPHHKVTSYIHRK